MASARRVARRFACSTDGKKLQIRPTAFCASVLSESSSAPLAVEVDVAEIVRYVEPFSTRMVAPLALPAPADVPYAASPRPEMGWTPGICFAMLSKSDRLVDRVTMPTVSSPLVP
jgi:hypothetical protein